MFCERPLSERIAVFEQFNGPIDSPYAFVDFCVYMGRQTGKTTKLIQSLPADEDIVLVTWKSRSWGELKNRIAYERKDINLKRIHFVEYDRPNWEDNLKGYTNRDIYFENEVLDMIAIDFVRKINAQYGKKNNGKK